MKPGFEKGRRSFRPSVAELERRRLLSLITVASFSDSSAAFNPDSLVVDSGGNIYGTTSGGLGAVFGINAGSSAIATLATFNGTNGDGPSSITEDAQGNLYGTTLSGGQFNWGTLFRATKSGGLTVLHSFDDMSSGANPATVIVDSQGGLHGTTLNGPDIEQGPGGDFDGTVFSGGDYADFRFPGSGADGESPNSLVVDGQGNLYGTTLTGAGADGDGTVFQIPAPGASTPWGNTFTLATFNGTNEFNPSSLVMDSQGNLYGIANGGADNDGAVFEIARGSNTVTALASFNGTDGSDPYPLLLSTGQSTAFYADTLVVDGQGNLYGTTYKGGADNDGTVFEIARGSNTITTLATFNGSNGKLPTALILNPQGTMLVGTTLYGGASFTPGSPDPGSGTVFAIPLAVPTLSSISPSRIGAGYSSPITVTVDGSGFVSGAMVNWNATALATTYVSSTELTATIPASDFASATNATITVTNPTPGGGTSAGLTFQVVAAPTSVFVNGAWAGDPLGTAVTWTDGTTHYVGYDAFGTIQAGINAVAAGGTVDVAAGTYSETDTIARSLTISGAGAAVATVDGAGAGSVFTIDYGATATIAGLTITGGQDGGVSNDGMLTISNTTITGNSASSGGGIDNAGGTLTIESSTIENNSALEGGGGIFITGGNVSISSCSILDNVAADTSSGGGIFNEATLTISDSVVSGNSSTQGAGIFDEGPLTLTGSLISNNAAIEVFDGGADIGGDGGGFIVYFSSNTTVTIDGCTFSGNTATVMGGGILNGGGTVTIAGSTITGNSSENGGGILNDSIATISNSTIAGNMAVNGAGIENGGTVTIGGSTIAGNSSRYEGGGIANYSTATIGDSTIAGNTASVEGSGIWSDGSLNISDSTIALNNVGQSGVGGGLVVSTTTLLDNTIVAANTGGSGAPFADIIGTVSSSSAYNLIGTGGSGGLTNGINGNRVGVANPGLDPAGLQGNGGPTDTIALLATSPAIDAGSNALAVDADGNPLQYDQRGAGYPRIADNLVDIGAFEYQGPFNPAPTLSSLSPSQIGAGYNSPITVIVDGSSFVSGAMVNWNATALATTYVSSTELTATIPASDLTTVGDATITVINPAPGGGTSAGLTFQVLAAPTSVFVNGAWAGDPLGTAVTWTDGTTHYVGYDAFGTIQAGVNAVAADGTVDVAAGTYTETDTIARSMTIDGAGSLAVTVNGAGAGSVFTIQPGITATIAGLTITGGDSANGGGGVLNDGGTITINNCTFTGNAAPGTALSDSGAGLSNTGDGTATISGCTFSDNSATGLASGGAIYNDGTLTVSDSTIVGNSALGSGGGGGIYGHGGKLTIEGSTIEKNSAVDGGGILVNGGDTSIDSCAILNNAATQQGGGIYGGATLAISGSIISGNSSNYGGGILDVYSLTLTDCLISDNVATPPFAYGRFKGGGLAVINETTVTIDGCTFSGNTATDMGGGIFDDGGTLTITDSTIAGNWAEDGGGINSDSIATLVIADSTIAGNTASSRGGGVTVIGTITVTISDSTIALNNVGSSGYGGGLYTTTGTALLNNSIVAENTSGNSGSPDDIDGAVSSSSTDNLIGTGGSGGLTNGVDGNQVGVADPGLDPNGLQNNGGPTQTIALEAGSPAIDAGSNALAVDANGNPLQYDQRGPGYPRIVNGTVDIGAFEYQGPFNPVPALSSISPSRIGAGYSSPITLTVDGAGFVSGAMVDWNGTALTTTYVSSTELTAAIPASDFASVTNASITVTNPAPGGGTSAGLTFQVLAGPPTVFVNASWAGDAPGTTVTWTDGSTHYVGYDAFATIQASINAVAAGGTVDVAAGFYRETETISRNITIDGAGTSAVIVDGAGAGSVFTIAEGVTATITDLTITGGNGGFGGGIRNNGGTIAVEDCAISGDTASFGGGVTNYHGTMNLDGCTITGDFAKVEGGGIQNIGMMTLDGCTITDNSTPVDEMSDDDSPILGGGLINTENATMILDGCSITGNSSSYGGGMDNNGSITLTGCTITGNSASFGPGGVSSFLGTVMLLDSTISSNSAGAYGGGGLSLALCTATLEGCTISGNSAAQNGGGLYGYNVALAVESCTIAGNSAGLDGGGVFDEDGGSLSVVNSTIADNTIGTGGVGGGIAATRLTPLLDNTIVALNIRGGSVADDIAGSLASTSTNNLIGTGGSGGLANGVNGNQVDVADSLLSALGNYGGPTETIALLPGSPAIGAGTAIAGITTDQRGVTLPDSGIDIGAFQSQGFTLSIISGTPQSATVNTAFAVAMAVSVTANDPLEPVAGGVISFEAPTSGASATLSSTAATIGSSGEASIMATANGTVGSYTVTASAAGAASALDFELTNAPLNLTADLSVTYGGFVYNRSMREFTQTLTIKNISRAPIIGPIELVLLNLKNATLANETGTYQGNPYITILSSGSLGVGQSLTITLNFVDPTLAPISYISEFLAGPLPDFD
jgi:uncharacterized repeat protein (TIGR03803 family)